MEALADMMVATADLVEAEGRALRRGMLHVAIAVLLVVVAAMLALLGFGFLLYGLFWLLATKMSVPAAAAVFGAVSLILAGAFSWIARRMIA